MTWVPNTSLDRFDVVFGVNQWEGYMPPMDEIPEEFKQQGNSYIRVVERWFFSGVSDAEIGTPRVGINRSVAIRHLAALLRSFAPSHEHKEAGVAYLMSLWFELPKLEVSQ